MENTQTFTWVHQHRFGDEVYLFNYEATEEEVVAHIEEVTATPMELDREDEWLTNMGAIVVQGKN
jgi:hypothetical protein